MIKRIEKIKSDAEAALCKSCEDYKEMPDTFEFEDEDVTVTLTHNDDGWYEVTEAYVADENDIRQEQLEDALIGYTIDLTDMAELIEDIKDGERRYENDPYDFFGVSRSDFV